MKRNTYLLLLLSFLFQYSSSAQGFVQIGTPLLDNQGNRMIALSDGSYITVGLIGNSAVMHKTDCLGNLLATLEKQVSPGNAEFFDVIELPDGNLVAAGRAIIATATDTLNRVFLLKATPGLTEISSGHFLIQNKAAQSHSLVLSNSGALMVLGEVEVPGLDITDIFVQKVDANTLQPMAAPAIFNIGLDVTGRIIKASDGQFVLSGHSIFGNPFDPNEKADNVLWLIKVDESGAKQWQVEIPQELDSNNGVATIAGVQQSNASGNFMLAGTLFGGDAQRAQDGFFALVSSDGALLDTAFASAPGNQQYFSILSHQDNPGLFTVVGQGAELLPGLPTLAFAQAYEFANTIFVAAASVDPTNPVALREVLELDPGRFAYMGSIPDNQVDFSQSDIIIATPGVDVGIVYQNCALAATLNVTAVAFQWYYEGQPIQGANQGVYFPTKPGLYAIQVLDAKGCSGISDTFALNRAAAFFDFTASNLTVEFNNLSTDATQYQWNFGDGGASVSINPTHTYAAGGVYNVTLIAKTSCGPAFADTLTQQVIVMSSSAEEPGVLDKANVFPNPTTGKITVLTSCDASSPADICLRNTMGQVLLQEQISGVYHTDLTDLPSGIYTLSLRSGNALKTFQVIKQ